MATFAMKAAATYWDGSAYTYNGEGQLGIPDGTETFDAPSKGVVRIPSVPVPSSLTFRLMSNPVMSFYDSEFFQTDNNFDNGFD